MSEILLPKTRNEITVKSPSKLVIYSQPKTGKTTLVAGLDNCLLLDLESGSDFVSAMSIKASSYQEIHNICEQIKKDGKPYKYIAIDTATELESMVLPLALKLYQGTPMGRNYTDNILNLPNGAGYLYLRQAFEMMLDKIQAVCERTILLCHIKDKIVVKNDKEVSAKDVDLTGKLRNIVCKDADAIGYLYRQDNKCYITFETSDDITCGARPMHLRNRSFVLSEQDQHGKTTTYWDHIFVD